MKVTRFFRETLSMTAMKIIATIFSLALICPLLFGAAVAEEIELQYRPSPLDNPLRGLVPYASQMPRLDPQASQTERDRYFDSYQSEVFPHSIEFSYFSMRELMPQQGRVDFAPIEKVLQQVNGRGCQLTFRVYLEYPAKPDRGAALPQFLIDQGLKVTKWVNDNEQTTHTPDYNDAKLQTAIDLLIRELGSKYDGDPRVACLTMGILGHWGEWHTYPRSELFPDKQYQTRVMDQFENAFQHTPVLMRYASGDNDPNLAANADRPFGFHDDSFAWATLATGRPADDWFFMAKMNATGALDAWKTRMIGGEIRPELWGCIFDRNSCEKEGQEFDRCVEATHATWLMDSGMFGERGKKTPADRLKIAAEKVSHLGYELFISNASLESQDGQTVIEVKIKNRGVAPFYFNWQVEVAVLDSAGNVRESVFTDWKLPSILPGEEGIASRSVSLERELRDGDVVALRIPNPLKGGKALRFANTNQQLDGESWLLLK